MHLVVKKYCVPGKWEVVIPFEKAGEEAEKAVAGRQNFEKRYFELADAMKKKASEMNGLDSQDVSYREKEQQWNSMRQKSFDLESKMGGIPEQPKKQEKSFWAKMQNAIRSGFWINKIR